MGSEETSSTRDSKSCHADDFPNAPFFLELKKVAAEFDEKQRIDLRDFQSNQALEEQRQVLTLEADEEIHRRDRVSLGVLQTLKKDLNRLGNILAANTVTGTRSCTTGELLCKAYALERQFNLRGLGSSQPRDGIQRSTAEYRKRNCDAEVGSANVETIFGF